VEESQPLIVRDLSLVGLNRNAKACQTEVNQKPGQAYPIPARCSELLRDLYRWRLPCA
jgi:hypothetical protein